MRTPTPPLPLPPHACAVRTGAAIRTSHARRIAQTLQTPHADRVIFAAAANISIASLNLSLMVNSVGFYQISKLLIIPFTAAVEALWLRDMLSMPQTICTAVVLSGVAIVCVPSAGPGLQCRALPCCAIVASKGYLHAATFADPFGSCTQTCYFSTATGFVD